MFVSCFVLCWVVVLIFFNNRVDYGIVSFLIVSNLIIIFIVFVFVILCIFYFLIMVYLLLYWVVIIIVIMFVVVGIVLKFFLVKELKFKMKYDWYKDEYFFVFCKGFKLIMDEIRFKSIFLFVFVLIVVGFKKLKIFLVFLVVFVIVILCFFGFLWFYLFFGNWGYINSFIF